MLLSLPFILKAQKIQKLNGMSKLVIKNRYSTIKANYTQERKQFYKPINNKDSIKLIDGFLWLKSNEEDWAKVGKFKIRKNDTLLMSIDSFKVLNIQKPDLLFGSRRQIKGDSIIELEEIKAANGIGLSPYRYNEEIGSIVFFLPISYKLKIVHSNTTKEFECNEIILKKEIKQYIGANIKINDNIIISNVIVNFSNLFYFVLPDFRLKVVKSNENHKWE